VDWASVVPGAITGIVGIAGIGGSIVSAKLAGKSATQNLQTSIAAENERARLADKRRIYASFQASMDNVYVAIDTAQTSRAGADREQHVSDMRAAATTMLAAMTELQLIAPKDLRNLATDVGNLTARHFRAAEEGRRTIQLTSKEGAERKFAEERLELYRAMRADLGEPVSGNERPVTPTGNPSQPADPAPGGGG
jgi:hypothetical protein